jgi:hypothetical protein
VTTSTQRLLPLTAAGLLLTAFILQGLACIDACAPTFDEATHLTAGYSYLATGDFRLNREHPPLLKYLWALPDCLLYRLPFAPDPQLWEQGEQWHIADQFVYHSGVPADRLLFPARLVNLLLGAALAALAGWWAYRLWGGAAGVVALALACFDPTLVAHASLITPDVGLALFATLALYLLWEHVRRPSRPLLLAVGVALGLALASKFTAVVLAVVLVAVIGLHRATGRWPHGKGALSALVRILLVAGLVIVLAYGVRGFPSWGMGLGVQLGRSGGAYYFLGECSSRGWLSYYPVAFLLKTPVGTLLLLAAALALWRLGKPPGRTEVLCLLVPALLFFAAVTAGRVDLGVRYLLPCYPFLFIAAARLATVGRRLGPALAAVAVALTAASVLQVAPRQLAYFNELAGGPAEGHRYLADSNLDWGQDLKGLRAFLEREKVPVIYLSYFGTAPPEAYGIRAQSLPTFGQLGVETAATVPADAPRELLAVSINNRLGIYLGDHDLYRWLDARTPLGRIGYSICVYDVSGDADAHRHLAEVYRRTGRHDLAAAEMRKVLALEAPRALKASQGEIVDRAQHGLVHGQQK